MMLSACRRFARPVSGRSLTTMSGTLVERRVGEAGPGGHASEAAVKVALFGASGFLGNYVCGELGTHADADPGSNL